MFTGYSTVSSVVVLWLMLGYFCFSYLIRTVVFINRHRSLDCCTVLSGKVSCRFCCCDVFRCFVRCFLFLVVGLVLQRGCEYLPLGVDTVLILCLILFLFTVLRPLCGLLGYPICTVQITSYDTAVWNWWLAICTRQVTLYSTAECDMKFARCNLHYTILQYGTGDLQFALSKLHYTVLQNMTWNLLCAIYIIRYCSMERVTCKLQCASYNIQFCSTELMTCDLHCAITLYVIEI
jgi:hypothetical protein